MTSSPSNLLTKSGKPLHPIGIGTWAIGTHPIFSAETAAEVAALRQAIGLGQNHIDGAEMYADGGAEQVIGQAIHGETREDLFIASKIWKNHVANGMVRPAVEAMQKRLGTDYLDLLYIHAPWFDAPWQQAIPQIDQLIDEGIVRHFGVSNFNAERLSEALAITRHPIVANQMHYSWMHQTEVTSELRNMCNANDIAIVAYRPLERGDMLQQPILLDIAQRYGKTPAQIALAWALTQDCLLLAKAIRPEHVEQNIAATSIQLKPEDVARLSNFVPTIN